MRPTLRCTLRQYYFDAFWRIQAENGRIYYLAVLPIAIVRNMLIRTVSIPARRPSIRKACSQNSRPTVQCWSDSEPTMLIQAWPYLTLPNPPRPLKSVEMPRGEFSAISSLGIVLIFNEDVSRLRLLGTSPRQKVATTGKFLSIAMMTQHR